MIDAGCHIFHLPEPSLSYASYLKSLWRLFKDKEYHVVHAHTMFNCGWAMCLAKLCGVPVRVAHSHSALTDGKSLVKSVYEAAMRLLINTCATDFIACGVAAGKRLYGEKKFAKCGKLILNGIDTNAFRYDEAKRAAIRAQLGIEDRFVIGHAGHLVEVKNQSFLLERMPEILERRPDAVLLLLGEGPDRGMLDEKIRSLQLEDHVIMTGNVTNVGDYLSAMDVFAFPSLYEGMPLSILEVQANGLPCILSDRVPKDVHLTDLIKPLALETPEAWVEAILEARRKCSAGYAEKMKLAGFDVTTAMEKIYEIYEKGK